MADGDIWRMDEAAGGPAQKAVVEITTTSGKKAFAFAAMNIQLGTTAAAVYWSAQGCTAP